ncbi:MAG: adenylate/guanylate cyclase domain-containing protein [Betaproteobacteria bacterium]|nr:adenylate/guanylate cyclase domain-containing protein [Betaproteobacteria bacterium]
MKRLFAAFAAAALALAALEIFFLHAAQPLEHRLLDAFVRDHAARLAPDPDVVIVDIDEKSLAQMQPEAGRFPWPRVVYAELLEGLMAQKPRAVVFDLMFSEADKFRPESDRAFVQAALAHRNVFFPMLRLDPRDDANGVRATELAPLVGLVRRPNADPETRIAVVPPLALPSELWRGGPINYLEDADGVGRRYLLRSVIGGWELPSLPARVALELGFAVPDAEDFLLAWRGKARGLPRASFADVYEDFGRGKRTRPADEFTGKIVVIGAAAPGLGDLRVTPLSATQPGVEILATAIENLKNGRATRRAPDWAPFGAALLLIGALYAAFARNIDAGRSALGLGGASALLAAGSWFAAGKLLLVPLLAPLAAAWLYYFAAGLAAYLRERRARQETIAMFSRFVNPYVVRELLERGGLEGAGQTREVTLLFSDIRGFTTLSESRRPEEVVDILNRYFTRQVEVIFRHGGSLDKFIGDAIMAFWGAPLDDPKHAQHAVACALEMADELLAFREELGDAGKAFDVGIGLHSGPAVVGLIGSERRREYTSIGDTVNLASRIEGLTKDAGRRILVSRDTMERCAGAFDFVSCGTYPVKGRAQPVELFEPRRKS